MISLHSRCDDTTCTFRLRSEATTTLFWERGEGSALGSDTARDSRRLAMNASGEEWKEKVWLRVLKTMMIVSKYPSCDQLRARMTQIFSFFISFPQFLVTGPHFSSRTVIEIMYSTIVLLDQRLKQRASHKTSTRLAGHKRGCDEPTVTILLLCKKVAWETCKDETLQPSHCLNVERLSINYR